MPFIVPSDLPKRDAQQRFDDYVARKTGVLAGFVETMSRRGVLDTAAQPSRDGLQQIGAWLPAAVRTADIDPVAPDYVFPPWYEPDEVLPDGLYTREGTMAPPLVELVDGLAYYFAEALMQDEPRLYWWFLDAPELRQHMYFRHPCLRDETGRLIVPLHTVTLLVQAAALGDPHRERRIIDPEAPDALARYFDRELEGTLSRAFAEELESVKPGPLLR